jgi:hypothetical protein
MARKPQKKAIARALGVSPSRVTGLVAAGMPLTSVDAASGWYAENVRRYTKPEPTPSRPMTSARQRLETVEADLKELELAIQRGELVNKAAAERAAYQTGKAIQHRLLEVFPAQVADLGCRATTPEELERLLRAGLREALREWLPPEVNP